MRVVSCLTAGPQPVLYTVWSTASSLNLQYPLFSLASFSGCLPLLPHLLVTYFLPSIFPLIMCFRRQFQRKMWPIQLAFLVFTVCTICNSSLPLGNIPSFLTRSLQLAFSNLLQHHISKLSKYLWSATWSFQLQHHTKLCSKCSPLIVYSLFPKFKLYSTVNACPWVLSQPHLAAARHSVCPPHSTVWLLYAAGSGRSLSVTHHLLLRGRIYSFRTPTRGAEVLFEEPAVPQVRKKFLSC